MSIEKRIEKIERRTRSQGAMREPTLDTDSLIRKMGFDPVKVRATAKANEQSIAWVIAGELGMSYKDFFKTIEKRARGD